jgi:hypothetical protein
MRCGLLCDRVVGPFFFTESTITGYIYLDLLQLYVFPQIEDVEREPWNWVIFMQDGAHPHFSLPVRGAFNEKFPNARIGRGGPISWPPGSPDLTPMDCFLWGYVKNCVYGEKIRDFQHLRDRIATVTPEIIQRTWHEIEYRLDVCRATNGAHIEIC